MTYVARLASGPLYPHTNVNTISPVAPEIWKWRIHVRKCRCTQSLTCVKRLASWSLAAPNFGAICPALPEIRNTGVPLHARTCAPADALHP